MPNLTEHRKKEHEHLLALKEKKDE